LIIFTRATRASCCCKSGASTPSIPAVDFYIGYRTWEMEAEP
jgi:hypothetical protein